MQCTSSWQLNAPMGVPWVLVTQISPMRCPWKGDLRFLFDHFKSVPMRPLYKGEKGQEDKQAHTQTQKKKRE